MQKWEYLNVYFASPSSRGEFPFNPVFINGVIADKGVKRQTMEQHMAQLGNEGWELAHGDAQGENLTAVLLIFKRPKS
jgi:hypothetical protein